MTDAIPSLARDVRALFDAHLEDRRFGDLDASSLESLADAVRARATAVDAARASLEDAQAALDEARRELTRRAEQALAYARIHGADEPEVAEAVAAIDAAREAPKKRKKRRAKAAPARPAAADPSEELPFARASNG